MYLLIIILQKEELLDNMLSILTELGITTANIIDSVGMGKVLGYDIPLFAGFRRQLEGQRAFTKTIMAVTEDGIDLDEIKEIANDYNIDFNEEGTGYLFTVKIEDFLGTPMEWTL
ncbi:hypothetical protein JXI42_10905 [bacterium]|nr:hypothetical protein [bacterium]